MGRRGGTVSEEDVLSSVIMLELAEMVEDDPLIAETSGVKREDEGDTILVLGGREMSESSDPGDPLDAVESPLNHNGGKARLRKREDVSAVLFWEVASSKQRWWR